MRKTLILLAALLSSAVLFAQEPQQNEQPQQQAPPAPMMHRRPQLMPGQYLGFSGQTTVTPQGSYTPDFKIDGSKAKIKNVILLIGDGMGLGAVTSAMFANGNELTMTNLQTIGFVRTQSVSDFTTDSAASGTAWATGHKTNNGYVGVGPDGEKLTNIPEAIAPYGYVSGVVSTDGLAGATPATFYAHQSARGESAAIWGDIPGCSLIFLAAGSKKEFETLPLSTQDAIKGQYTVLSKPDADAFANADKICYTAVNVGNGRGDWLPATTQTAIDFLKARTKKGFFLMVEGAHIDHEAHANKATLVQETLDFDKAIEAAVRFAEKDGHTLVIVSADHETGAVVVRKGNFEDNSVEMTFASRGHSPMMVPLFAYGPGSKQFARVQENSDVSNMIRKILIGK